MRYLEDFAPGQRMTTPAVEMPQAETIAFAKKYDPQAMHIDPVGAAAGPLKGLSASGWHTAAVVMSMIAAADPLDGGPILGMGVDELRWPVPVRPGDTITAEIEVVSVTPSRSRPSHGVVRIHVTARNQRGEIVYSMFPNLWVPRRAAAQAQEPASAQE
jgi:acyl dehydratase